MLGRVFRIGLARQCVGLLLVDLQAGNPVEQKRRGHRAHAGAEQHGLEAPEEQEGEKQHGGCQVPNSDGRGRLLERQHAQHRAEVHEEQRGEHAGAYAVRGDERCADRSLVACAQHQQRAYGHADGEQVARGHRAQQPVELLVEDAAERQRDGGCHDGQQVGPIEDPFAVRKPHVEIHALKRHKRPSQRAPQGHADADDGGCDEPCGLTPRPLVVLTRLQVPQNLLPR